MAVYRYVGLYDMLHLFPDGIHILCRHLATDAQVAIIAVRHGSIYDHAALWKEFVYSLAENEEQRAGICAHTRR